MVISSETYYADKKILFKPINATIRNQQRLKNTKPSDTLNEILKNAIEHGNGLVSIQYIPATEAKLVIFNSMDSLSLNKLTFKQIIQKLTTFQETSDSNFHEGLTTILLFHARIRTREFFIQNKMSEDGYYQYIENASHFINDQGQTIPIDDLQTKGSPQLKGWEITIFEATPDLFKLTTECLKDFYRLKQFKLEIQINGIPNQLPIFEWPRTYKMLKLNGLFNYHLEFTPVDNAVIEIYWRLNNAFVMQKIRNNQFNNRNVQGTIVLTSINQFANENRIELSQDMNQFIEDTVQGMQNSHLVERVLKQELEQYDQYKTLYLQYLIDLLETNEKNLHVLFVDAKKEQSLLKVSEFIFTLNELLKSHKEYRKPIPKLFHLPQKDLKILKETTFHLILSSIKYSLKEFRERFPRIPLGLKILNGDPEGFLFTGELMDFLYGQKLLHIIDPTVYFQDILTFNNTQGILYPTNMQILYFIDDIVYKYIKNGNEFQEYTAISPEKVATLNEFAIGQNKQDNNRLQNLISSESTQNDQNTKGKTISSNSLESNGTKLILDIFEVIINKKAIRIPLLYPKELVSKMKEEKKDIKNKVMKWIKLYGMFKESIELITRNTNEFEGKALNPVLLFDPRNVYGLFLHRFRIVALNVLKSPLYEDPIAQAQYIVNIVCHELAHENSPNHGMIHEQKFEKFLRIAENKDKLTQEFIIRRLSRNV